MDKEYTYYFLQNASKNHLWMADYVWALDEFKEQVTRVVVNSTRNESRITIALGQNKMPPEATFLVDQTGSYVNLFCNEKVDKNLFQKLKAIHSPLQEQAQWKKVEHDIQIMTGVDADNVDPFKKNPWLFYVVSKTLEGTGAYVSGIKVNGSEFSKRAKIKLIKQEKNYDFAKHAILTTTARAFLLLGEGGDFSYEIYLDLGGKLIKAFKKMPAILDEMKIVRNVVKKHDLRQEKISQLKVFGNPWIMPIIKHLDEVGVKIIKAYDCKHSGKTFGVGLNIKCPWDTVPSGFFDATLYCEKPREPYDKIVRDMEVDNSRFEGKWAHANRLLGKFTPCGF